MSRYQRNYIAKIEDKNFPTIEIRPPFTMDFDVNKMLLGAKNEAVFKFYNLSENNRNSIRKDDLDVGYIGKHITVQAGYGDSLATIFTGTVRHAWSVRHGSDFITEIHADDGGIAFLNGVTMDSFPKDTDIQVMVNTLLKSMPNTPVGATGQFPGKLTRGAAFVGNTAEILTTLTGGGFFINDGRAYCLGDNEVIRGDIDLINLESGLLGTPKIEHKFIYVDILFEPRLLIGQKVELESITYSKLNSLYKVIAIHHKGTISGSICGNATTTLGLTNGLGIFRQVERAN